MAASLTLAIDALKKAKAELAQRELRKSPEWYLEMFRTEVDCCATEVNAWQQIQKWGV